MIARQRWRGLAELATEVEAPLVSGEQSLKAALDRQVAAPPEARDAVAVAEAVRDQDIQTLPGNVVQLRPGIAKDWRISEEDGEMRRGRKSRSQLVDGYKRHILRDLDAGLVRAVGITAANIPEASVTDDLLADLTQQDVHLREIHLDRAGVA